MALRTFEMEPTQPQRGSVIWLHGLGASPRDFEAAVPELGTPFLRFIFPFAPVRSLTVGYGMRMPAWYDILSLGPGPPRENEAHLRECAADLHQLMAREHEHGVAYENMVLAGFSQGGATVLHTGLRSQRPLAGILVLSGYLPAAHTLRDAARSSRRDTPIVFCHGRHDSVVPLAGGRYSYTLVKEAGYPAEWADFDVGHTLGLQEARFIGRWLSARFPKTQPR